MAYHTIIYVLSCLSHRLKTRVRKLRDGIGGGAMARPAVYSRGFSIHDQPYKENSREKLDSGELPQSQGPQMGNLPAKVPVPHQQRPFLGSGPVLSREACRTEGHSEEL